jgi:hypothetical protein
MILKNSSPTSPSVHHLPGGARDLAHLRESKEHLAREVHEEGARPSASTFVFWVSSLMPPR